MTPRSVAPYFLVLGLATFLVGGLFQAALDRSPLEYPDEPFQVDSPVRAPGPLHVVIPRCNTTDRDLHTTSVRILISLDSGERWTLQTGSINMAPGCEVVTADLYLLPLELPPGWYVLQTSAQTQGRIRVFTATHRSNAFEVIERKA